MIPAVRELSVDCPLGRQSAPWRKPDQKWRTVHARRDLSRRDVTLSAAKARNRETDCDAPDKLGAQGHSRGGRQRDCFKGAKEVIHQATRYATTGRSNAHSFDLISLLVAANLLAARPTIPE